ncbi:hypothetical protein FJT64_013126 [Amphibalanus amphitrite]|uniref:Uncharacterized protein n=1 Tax=Amphibalanus amphitrite TaxID=1232801 RepID=A0A6A4VDL4_AMPAM|nr:hypothetical protein FJT64_013126 [Amphibalanus amphitrite]
MPPRHTGWPREAQVDSFERNEAAARHVKRCRHGGHLKPGCCHGDLKPRRCHGDLLHWGDTSIDRRQFPRGE